MNNFQIIINPPASSIAFNLFGYPIRFYGLIIMVALVVGFFLINSFLKRNYSANDAQKFVDYSVFLVIFSIIGARLFYILGSLPFYIANPAEIIMINHGGISIWGAILFGLSTLTILSKKFNFSFKIHCAVIALFLPLCQAIGRWGNYFNQEAFGKPTSGCIKLFVDFIHRPLDYANNLYFHPAFLYESILDIIVFVLLLLLFKKEYPIRTIYCYLIFYSIVRLIVESVRIDSVLKVLNVPIASLISLVILITSTILLIISLKKPQ